MQLNVDHQEIQRRIESFIDRKRAAINQNNLRDFIDASEEESCARIAGNVYRIKDSKGHLKIKRVCNETGPEDQIKSIADTSVSEGFDRIEERIKDVETFIGFAGQPIARDIYERLKLIEDEVQHLKTISPEYSHFVSGNKLPLKKKTVYSVEELDKMITALENKG